MIQTQNVDVVLTAGVDTKTTPDNTLASNMTELLNVRQDKIGAFVPRDGFQPFVALGTGVPFEAIADESQLVVGAGNFLYSASSGRKSLLNVAARGTLARSYYGDVVANSISLAASPTEVCMVWLDKSQPFGAPRCGILIFDAATGRTTYQNVVVIGATDGIQVVYCDGYFYLFLTTTHNLRAYQIDLTQPSSFPFQVAFWPGAPTATTRMRFAATSNGSKIAVAYSADSSGTVGLQTITSTSSAAFTVATVPNAITTTTVAKGVSVATVSTGAAVFAVGAGNDGVSYQIALFTPSATTIGSTVSYAMASTATVEQVRLSRVSGGGAQAQVFGIDGSTQNGRTYTFTVDSGGILFSNAVAATGQRPISGAAVVDSNNFFMCDAYTSAAYGSQALVSDQYLSASLGVSMNVGSNLATERPQMCNPVKVGSKWYFGVPAVTGVDEFTSNSATLVNNTPQTTVGLTPKIQASLVTWDTAATGTSLIERNNNQRLYVGTGTASLATNGNYAGVWPEPLVNVGNVTCVSGGTEAAGVVSYTIAKLWISPDGAEYRTYSELYTVKILANYQLQLAVRQQEFTVAGEGQSIVIELYRTERNGTIFYKTASTNVSGNLTDTTTDTDLIKGRLADINAGELPPTLVPSARIVTKFKDRLVIVPSDYPNKLFFEKPVNNPNGTVFADGLEIELPEGGGNITGVFQMDSALYIFKQNSVFTLYGEMPGATGEGSTLNTPQVIFDGLGCIDPRSVVLTQKGLMFKSEKGFYLILRNQQVQFIGQGPYNDRTSVVVGSGQSSAQAEVYFAHANGDLWVFNTDIMGWYNWYIAETPGGLTCSNTSLFVVTGTEVLKSTPGATTDLVNTVPLPLVERITTGWIRINHIRGFQRVRRAYFTGKSDAPCQVTIEVMTDYNNTPVQTFTFNTGDAGVQADPLQIDLHLAVQKCEALCFRVRTGGYGLELAGVTLELGLKQGLDKSRSSGSGVQG